MAEQKQTAFEKLLKAEYSVTHSNKCTDILILPHHGTPSKEIQITYSPDKVMSPDYIWSQLLAHIHYLNTVKEELCDWTKYAASDLQNETYFFQELEGTDGLDKLCFEIKENIISLIQERKPLKNKLRFYIELDQAYASKYLQIKTGIDEGKGFLQKAIETCNSPNLISNLNKWADTRNEISYVLERLVDSTTKCAKANFQIFNWFYPKAEYPIFKAKN
jgi:hypothetical protein